MFTSQDLSIIHNPYFTVLRLTEETCELQSNNTRHCWYIKPSPDGFYYLYHKHHSHNPYHFQSAAASIQDILLDIADHDDYQLRRRKPIKNFPTDTFFNHILKVYE